MPHLENGTLFLIGSTTENPSFQVVPALLSRVQVIRLENLSDEVISKVVEKGFDYLEKDNNQNIEYTPRWLILLLIWLVAMQDMRLT